MKHVSSQFCFWSSVVTRWWSRAAARRGEGAGPTARTAAARTARAPWTTTGQSPARTESRMVRSHSDDAPQQDCLLWWYSIYIVVLLFYIYFLLIWLHHTLDYFSHSYIFQQISAKIVFIVNLIFTCKHFTNIKTFSFKLFKNKQKKTSHWNMFHVLFFYTAYFCFSIWVLFCCFSIELAYCYL